MATAAKMTGARDIILGEVRGALVARRLGNPPSVRPATYIRPLRAQGSRSDLAARFCEMATFSGATVIKVADDAAVPAAVARFLSREGLGDRLILSSSDRLSRMPWKGTPRLSVRRSRFGSDDRVALTETVAGVAETGTLLVRSGDGSENGLHLLPEAHIAVVDGATIVGSYEDALEVLGAECGDHENWPRAVTFITGPSRTADIEKTPQIGVHGPRQLHIILVHGEAP